MKMLTGLLPASERRGADCSGGTAARGDVEARRRVGYMSQAFSLYNELTVRQNLELHARLFHVPAAQAAARIARADDALRSRRPWPTCGRRNCRWACASGCNWRSRCCIGREMLILDEPTSGVDPAARDQFWHARSSCRARTGVTIFISTHFMNEAARCDRVVADACRHASSPPARPRSWWRRAAWRRSRRSSSPISRRPMGASGDDDGRRRATRPGGPSPHRPQPGPADRAYAPCGGAGDPARSRAASPFRCWVRCCRCSSSATASPWMSSI